MGSLRIIGLSVLGVGILGCFMSIGGLENVLGVFGKFIRIVNGFLKLIKKEVN